MKIAFLLISISLLSCEPNKSKVKSFPTEVKKEINRRTELSISSRIDTSNKDIKAIFKLYENYINSSPDSIYNNPYWNKIEKAKYKDFDFSRVNIYNGITSDQLLKIYQPFVLSVEPINNKYQIRVLYSNAATEPPYVGSKVWCIHKLSAIQENHIWKLENLLIENTADWNKKQIDFIEYIYPKRHSFDNEKANTAISFCRSIINRFNKEFDGKFSFYMANDVDKMGELENFDYYFTGITTGKAREGMILSSLSDEHYPHEFIHKLMPINKDRGYVIEEGVAAFLGTKEDKFKYQSEMKKLADDFNTTETFTLENILNNNTKWNGYQVAYPGGALICEVIHDKKGDEGVNMLIRGNTNGFEEILTLSMNILKLNQMQLESLIENKLGEYK